MNSDEIHRAYEAYSNPAAARARERLGNGVAVSARGATVTLADGRELVDLASGGFGYSHPKVIARVAEQVRKMPLSSRMFYSIPLARLAQTLANSLPGALEVCFFGNAGSEAVEGALKLVKGFHRKRTKVVAARGAYHGSTTGALSVSGIERLRRPLLLPGREPVVTELVPYGETSSMRRAVNEHTAAVVLQPVLTGADMQLPPEGYLRAVRARCSEVGALLVIDETHTGFGVTGRRWGVDHDGVVPDIIVLAGALGGGLLPMGAYVASRQVNDQVYDKQDPLLHANTTGGNPSACVAALTALEVIEEEGLIVRSASHGLRIHRFFEHVGRLFPELVLQGSVRGLLGGLRLRGAETADRLQHEAHQRGVLVRAYASTGGEQSSLMVLDAPLLTGDLELERALTILEASFEAISHRRPLATSAEA